MRGCLRKKGAEEFLADVPGGALKLLDGAGDEEALGVVGGEGVAVGFEDFGGPEGGEEVAGFVKKAEFFGVVNGGVGGGKADGVSTESRIGIVGKGGEAAGFEGGEIVEGGLDDAAGEGVEGQGKGEPVADEEGDVFVEALVEEEFAKGGLDAGGELDAWQRWRDG